MVVDSRRIILQVHGRLDKFMRIVRLVRLLETAKPNPKLRGSDDYVTPRPSTYDAAESPWNSGHRTSNLHQYSMQVQARDTSPRSETH